MICETIDEMELTEKQARANLSQLLESFYDLVNSNKMGLASESDVLVFIERLFRDVLGWPTEDITRFQREAQVANRRRVDRILNLDNGDKIFIEAKRFGALGRLTDDWALVPAQMVLPGMAADRTPEEQQAINYAFQNEGTWAILTNFQIFRLFNARRDWLVFSFEAPRAYEIDFEMLWQLSWSNLNRGSLEALNSQRWTKDVDTDYLQFINRQREQLAIDITLNRQANSWAYTELGELRIGLLREVVQRFLDRLVVVRFAEDHFVIPPDTLRQFYNLRQANAPYTQELGFYLRDFFMRFDAEHNSALFAKSEVDEAAFSDDVLLPLIEELYGARYRAMSADVMGNTYEQYLGKTLVADNGTVVTQDNLETRKKQGSYYTPQYIVQWIVDQTLGKYLYATHNGKPNGITLPDGKRKTYEDIKDLRVLDSACGSGSFLIYAYEVLADFYLSEVARLDEQRNEIVQQLAKSNGEIPLEAQVKAQRIINARDRLRDTFRNHILERHLYGVDYDPQAAEIAVVNLMMRAMERKGRSMRLPLLLNQNVKVGNSIVGLKPSDPRLQENADELATIRRLRAELIATSNLDSRHSEIISELDSVSTGLYERLTNGFARLNMDAKTSQPFHWAIEFPEAFVGEAGQPLDNPGFHFIFGNPPYGAALSAAERSWLRREFNIGMTNSAGLFMAQSLRLLRDGGAHGFIVPKSFLYASNWGKLRERLLDGLETLVDCGRAWSEVLLEQVIYVHRKDSHSTSYRNLRREGQDFKLVGDIAKEECERFGFYVNAIDEAELQVARQMRLSERFLGEFSINRRGAGLQSDTNGLLRGRPVLGGSGVQRYHLRAGTERYDSSDVPDHAVINAGNILAQNILTRLQNPTPHIRIVAHLAERADEKALILDTVNQIEITSNDLTPELVLALLNSKLLNWYVYRFIYAKATLTMHFDTPVTDRIPLPDWVAHPELVESIEEEIRIIYDNRHANEESSQAKIDNYIFQLYGLNDEQIALVEATMP